MTEKKFNVVTLGKVGTGLDQLQVQDSVRELCKYTDATLAKVFSGQMFCIKSGLDLETAKRYKSALENTGLVCEIIPQRREAEPVAQPAKQVSSFKCPKCGFAQQQGTSCVSCCIVFEKYLDQQRDPQFYTPPPASPAVAPARRSGSGGFGKVVVAVVVLALVTYFGLSLRNTSASNEILLYTSNDCGVFCDEAKAYFDSRGAGYSEINIDASDENMRKFAACNVGSLPLAYIGGEEVIGFNEMAFGIAVDGLLGRQNGTLDTHIVMYSAPGCPGCNMARKYFTEQNIEFEEYDINDPAHSTDYRSYAPIGTPLIFIGGIRVNGFSKPAIEMALRQVEQI